MTDENNHPLAFTVYCGLFPIQWVSSELYPFCDVEMAAL